MIDAGEEHRQLAIAAAQQGFGALQHLTPTHFVADVGGRRVEVVLRSSQGRVGRGMGSLPNRALEVRVPLAVPSRIAIQTRRGYVHVGPVPIVPTGDPGFDATYVVVGAPSEVVQRALDETTRAWMRQSAQHELMLRTDESGALSVPHAVQLPRENPRRPVTPQLLAETANALRHFANALEASYRMRRAEIVAQQGEAAALAWEEHNRGLIAAQPLRWVRWALAGCLAVVVLVALAGVASFVVAMLRATG